MASKSDTGDAAAEKIIARCVRCRGEFTEAQTKGYHACPACGTEGVPMSPDEDVTVAINWHELRILTIWAENYANSIKHKPDVKDDPVQVVFSIAKHLQDQHPFLSPLTLSGEFEQLKKAYPGASVHGDITEGAPLPMGSEDEQ